MRKKVVIVGASSSPSLSGFIVSNHQTQKHEIIIIESKKRRKLTTASMNKNFSKSTMTMKTKNNNNNENKSENNRKIEKGVSEKNLKKQTKGKEEELKLQLTKSENNIAQPNDEMQIITGDIATCKGWLTITKKVIKKLERIDVIYFIDHHRIKNTFNGESNLEDARSMIDRNFIGPIFAISHLLPHLRSSNASVVLFVDTIDEKYRNSTFYVASKRALNGFFSTLAQEEANLNVIITSLDPLHSCSDDVIDSKAREIVNFVAENINKKDTNNENVIASPRAHNHTASNGQRRSKFLVDVTPEPLPFDVLHANKLSKAIYNQNKSEVKEILHSIRSTSSLLIEADNEGRTPLHYCAFIGNLPIADLILHKIKCKSLFNLVDHFKFTPLHVAAKFGHLKLVKRLIKAGSDPNALSLSNYAPIHFIARLSPDPLHPKSLNAYIKIFKLLLDMGAEANQRNADWLTPMHEAAKYNSDIAIRYLLANEGDPHRKTKTGGVTALHFAVLNANLPIIKIFLKFGADPSAVSTTFGSCFDIAPTPEILSALQHYRDKNRREELSCDVVKAREIIVISKFDDFCENDMKLIKEASLDTQNIFADENWPAFASAMSFITKKIYLTPRDDESKFKSPKIRSIESRARLKMTLDQAYEKFVTVGNPRKLFSVINLAGKGGYGRVYMARRIEDKKIVAIKRVSHISEKEQWNNYDEIYLMKQCESPYVVQFLSAYYSRDELWIVMEYMEGGCLSLAISRFYLDERQICYLTKKLLKGLKVVHEKKLAHRDLKSSNIMLSTRGDVKLIDFGLCADLSKRPSKSMVGSPYWIAPEMILRQPHTSSADLWSLGILCLEMANGKPPNKKSALRAMYLTGVGIIPTLDDPAKWSDAFRAFLSRILVFDPQKRATAEELLSDEWFRSSVSRRDIAGVIESIFIEKSLNDLLG